MEEKKLRVRQRKFCIPQDLAAVMDAREDVNWSEVVRRAVRHHLSLDPDAEFVALMRAEITRLMKEQPPPTPSEFTDGGAGI